MKMLNPRILAITSSVTLPMRSNMSTKRTSYYDTLEITPKATQNEIKTAYYKLTKQYHPDRNQSDEAKTKFRDVSEAYDVLGNFEKRKTYDRSLLTNRYPSQQVIYRSTDPKADYYRSQVPTKQSYQSSSFNFDEWTRMHYERTFERQMKLKMESKFKREYRQTAKAHHTVKPAEIAIAIFAMVSLGLAFVVTAFKEDYDRINTNNKR